MTMEDETETVAVYYDGDEKHTITIPISQPFNLKPHHKSMVEEESRKQMIKSFRRFSRIFLVLALSIGTLAISQHAIANLNPISKAQRNLILHREALRNAEMVKHWRSKVVSSCVNAKTKGDMGNVKSLALEEAFPIPKPRSNLAISQLLSGGSDHRDSLSSSGDDDDVQTCPFVFLDLGTGSGDSIGQFIDSGLIGCDRSNDKNLKSQGFNPMHFNVDNGMLEESSLEREGAKDEDFKDWVKDRIHNFYPSLGPEDYCVYGIEPNPILKAGLEKLERHISRMNPSPLRHVHFLTDTVVVGDDASRRTIYLDQAHVEERYPGTSLFFNHQYVRDSKEKYGEIVEHRVNTKSLTSLMKDTLSYYDASASETISALKMDEADNNNGNITVGNNEKVYEKNTRNHLILHIDVEGAEFHVLNEVKDSGILCDFALQGNFVDLFVEYHSPDFLGIESANALRYIHEVRPYFRTQCGDNLSFYERNRYFMPAEDPKILTNAVV